MKLQLHSAVSESNIHANVPISTHFQNSRNGFPRTRGMLHERISGVALVCASLSVYLRIWLHSRFNAQQLN